MSRPPVTPLTAKGGMLHHYCCICDSADCGHGLGPPAVPVEVWFCGRHVPEHLRGGRAAAERMGVAA